MKDLQNEFTSAFPFLEINFYKVSNVAERLASTLRVEEARRTGNSGLLYLDSDTSVAAVEHTFEDVFGLRTNIGFRKGLYGHCNKAAKTLRDLNNRAMQLSQEVVFL